MEGVIDTLVKATVKTTSGKRYNSHRFCYDTPNNSVIEYEPDHEAIPLEYGETERPKTPKDMRPVMEKIAHEESWFKYFLDGSRHTYKVDDMAFNNNVYPIIAGQVGVSCCTRVDKRLKNEFFNRRLVISLPKAALKSTWNPERQRAHMLEAINQTEILKKRGLSFDDVLIYKTDQGQYEKKGIATVQTYMTEEERRAVIQLVNAKKLNYNSYLIKDGSLEYQEGKIKELNLSYGKFKSYFDYVIGVSKSFDPTHCFVKGGGTDSSIIAGLEPYHRTPACRYRTTRTGEGVLFCVWYLRLRDSRYTKNVFDGVVKVEKILVTKDEEQHGKIGRAHV